MRRRRTVTASVHVERLAAGRLAAGIERDLLHPRFGLLQELLAAGLERLAALVHRARLLERHLATLEFAHALFELRARRLEGHGLNVGIGFLSHRSCSGDSMRQFRRWRAGGIGHLSRGASGASARRCSQRSALSLNHISEPTSRTPISY